MVFRFYEEEDTGEKCQWCRDHIGKDGDGWMWDLDQGQSTATGYRPTNVIIYIDSAIDATAYKLRW